MWLSKMLSLKGETSAQAEQGTVTRADGSGIEAGATVSQRDVESFAPYGYSACLPVGCEVALVSTLKGQLALGTKSNAQGLEQGEIKLSSLGGASIVLKNDGSVVINNKLKIDREGQIINE